MGRGTPNVWCFFAWIFYFSISFSDAGLISGVSPRHGSLAGETRLTIYGQGFSVNQFSQNDDPDVGNRVYLVSESGSERTCAVHKDGCTETQVMCYTPRGLQEERYYVRVVVDGERIPEDSICGGNSFDEQCIFQPKMDNTPTIRTFSPQSGMPGTFVTMKGTMYSDRYGSNMATATNGNLEKLLRVYVGPQDCSLKNGDQFFGLSLESEESDDGTLVCQTMGTSIGFYNASYIVDSPYGRSLPEPEVYRVSYNDHIYMLQFYTNISEISHSSGSTTGGLALTIAGSYYDNRPPYVQPKVFIGDTPCVITDLVVDQHIVCEVAANPQYIDSRFPGNRGVNFEYWTATAKGQTDLNSILSMSSSDPNYHSDWLDETFYHDVNNTMDQFVSRMTTFFTAPHTGKYQFLLFADDGARLFVDGVAEVTSTAAWAGSRQISLNQGQRVLLQVVHYESTQRSFVHLKAKFFDTKFTSAWTGKAEQEKQAISIRSDITYDVQQLNFATFGSQTSIQEVQTVEVTSGGEFRFGLFGAYTEPLTLDMDDEGLSAALSSLPVLGPGEAINVVRKPVDTPTFTLTFVSKRGDFPSISLMQVLNGSDITYTVTEDINGQPDLDTVSLTIGGSVSLPFSASSLSQITLESVMNSLFEAKCPTIFSGKGIAKHYESFESAGLFNGERVKDSEPFCGRYSLKNPDRIYQQKTDELGIMLSAYGTMCFAYKGFIQSYIWVKVTLKQASNGETVTRYHTINHVFQTDSDQKSETWYYTCVDVYRSVLGAFPTGSEHRLREAWVARGQADYYIDSLFIGKKETTTDTEVHVRRAPPARPNGALINEVIVTSMSATHYEVTLKPYECGNQLPMFELANAEVTSGSPNSPSNAVTSTLKNGGGSGVIKVTRSSAASPPVTGTIDVTFNGKTKSGLNVSLKADEIDRDLESLNGIGALLVEKEGSCANFDLIVTFLTLPGNQPEMEVNGGRLVGVNTATSIKTTTDGGLFYDPLTGDMLSTVHAKPQVRLYMNDIPAACHTDCSFSWETVLNPSVTSVSPTSGTSALSTSITIQGTGFSNVVADNMVTIAGVPCTVTTATSTSIVCDVGNGPVGAHAVRVNVAGKGFATSNVQFTYVANIDRISPTSGSIGGGLTLTISGYGFKSDAVVTVAANPCKVVSAEPGTVKCIVPTAASPGTYDVAVSQGGQTLTFSGFTYDNSLTAVITSISSTSIPATGANLTISGTSFGAYPGSVYIGDDEVMTTSWSDSTIEVSAVVTTAGDLDLSVETMNGLAVDSKAQIPTINVDLKITNVFPLKGSVQGGTKLTITGSGFGTEADLLSVKVGEFNCEVVTVTNSKIVCLVENAGTVHKVTNNGIDPAFGVFYAFDKPYLTVAVGDYVQWTWKTPVFVNNVAHGIYEVSSPSSTMPKVGGFNSGPPMPDGMFKYQFSKVGTYYVWSGYVDEWFIKSYTGTVEVVEAQSRSGQVSVTLGGVQALHELGGSADPVDSSSCGHLISAKSGCTDSPPTHNDTAKFNFAFHPCSSPVVTSINANNGTAKSEITIIGSGFSTKSCQNEVTFGGHSCDIIETSESSIKCMISKSDEPEIATYLPLNVRVHNRGNAIVNIMNAEDKAFAVIPSIESIMPSSGSTAGGALVTITGYGFATKLVVMMDALECKVMESSYTEIICETPPSVQDTRNITVTMMVNGAPLDAKCETLTGKCRYSFVNIYTPKIVSISPTTMSSTTEFTITGSLLGTDSSAVEVVFGDVFGKVTSATGSTLVVSVDNLPAGVNEVTVRVAGSGKASGYVTVTGMPVINGITPSSGSIHGNTTITISGNGFVADTSVLIGGSKCTIVSTSLSKVICVTSSHTDGSANVNVVSNKMPYQAKTFNYAASSSPSVFSISPQSGLPGSELTISGSNLAGGRVTVNLDGVNCLVTSSTDTEIRCNLGNHATGSVPVQVLVDGVGASNSDVMFEFQLALTSVSPSMGGTAGGQHIVLTGTGFSEDAVVTVCGVACPLVATDTTQYTCKTPKNTAQVCDVAMTVNGLTRTLSGVYTYSGALTPTIMGLNPARGGTGGGTTVTISGSGFGSDVNAVSVMIDGAECIVGGVINSMIECVTGPHAGSVVAMVEVQISGNGIAQEARAGDASFSYIDVWSSPFTWGGGPLPEAGDFIVIPAGMTLVLDVNTPVLAFLLIQGGKLIFDNKDVELQSNVIMITDGGLLQVGTEEEPFQHKGIITLHGHHRSKELPIYGTKVIAVRNGTLDLHGIEVPLTWSRLASTAQAGSSTITLLDPVEWNVGDEIAIASTGHHHKQSENEKKTIKAVSADKKTLTLTDPLKATHWGVTEMFDGTLVEFRAEVGLLTHNVVVRGNPDPQWEDEIKACEAGFDTGEFAVQTCFQGRFGDEIGSSQFGAMILIHSPVKDTQEVKARLSYVEVTFAGQAYRLGRYPIHFHLNGDMSTSYVRGCGIHKTFNRAVNIHGVHNMLVEKTVIYDIMGGAFFLEDGVETGNTFQYNLAIFVRESTSLLNDDVTPASFWLTNPNNTVQHNAAAGGSHFGFWYRMHSHPDGPSFDPNVCPDKVPLGIFFNNSAHSFGWFGLWVFEFYFPTVGGCEGTEPAPAVFERLFAWNNEKGAEAVNVGALQFKDFTLVQNKLAGYEGKKVNNVALWTDDSPLIRDSLIVGRTTVIRDSVQGCTQGGIVFPYGRGFRAINTRFVNFDVSDCATFRWTRITGTCSQFCGGFTYHAQQLKFVNAANKAIYEWEWEGIILDTDGTSTGKGPGWTVLPSSGTLPSNCESAPEFSIGIPASMCPPQHKWHRFAFNNIKPESLEGKNFTFTNEYGTSHGPYAKKRLTHKPGWMCALLMGATYQFSFEHGSQFQNISFTGQFYDFDSDDYLFLKVDVATKPDRFSINGGATFINATDGVIDPDTAINGDWEWDATNTTVRYIVHGRQRAKRAMSSYPVDRKYGLTLYKCFFKDCIPPPDPNTIPPASARPQDVDFWHDANIWNMTTDGYLSNIGGSSGIPKDMSNVNIAADTWMVVETPIAKLGTLLLEGVLEFNNGLDAVYHIEADYIVIRGGRLIIGWPDEPFLGQASITLRGNHDTPYFVPGEGPDLGSKAIGVYGGLDLFGKDVGRTWTQLAVTANVGSNKIKLADPVQWQTGYDIVIGPTSYNPWETESFRITAVAADNVTLTLNGTLKYKHLVHQETLSNGYQIDVGAAVGLLTHNIKVIGQDYNNLYKESFGARILVATLQYKERTFTGYARLSNVEFYHTGQEGFTEDYDPRFSVAYVATGTVSSIKPSKVFRCSFHNGFSTAIGAFGIGSLEISENVVFGSIGNGIRTSSNDTRLLNNLVALMVHSGTYQDRVGNYWEAGIEAMLAKELVMHGNLVTGSERLAYHVVPMDCEDKSGRYSNNKAFANVQGVVVFPEDQFNLDSECAKLANFTTWKTHDFGLYYQNTLSLVAENNVYIENQNGLLTMVLRPITTRHEFANKTVDVLDSIFIGRTSSFDCSKDVSPANDLNFNKSNNARPSLAPGKGSVGLIFPNFYQATNMAPGKPWKGCMAYNAIGGLMRISGNTFAKYGAGCKGAHNFAVSTNIGNDDGQHPVEATTTTWIDTDHGHKVFYHRPNANKINSADCVDMDCDALKKALLKDLDGTFLGHIGAVIPQSEFEWDTNPVRGLGDYRIPKEMLTKMDGTRIPVKEIAPKKGIIRTENCVYQSLWQAYECQSDINYEMLMIENMDADTETRRLSPVAVLGNGYLDLINGPQDHGWCSGYTCRKRISTFMALVATDEEFLIHFTSTTPEHMRYRLLNAGQDDAVKLRVWYSRLNRLDLFVDGTYLISTNAEITSGGYYKTLMPKGNELEPMVQNATGTNFFDKDTGIFTFIIKGGVTIDVKTSKSIIISFGIPAMTPEEFFGDNLVENIASFLNIPLTKVRIVSVVSASASGKRKRRSSEGVEVTIEIADEPAKEVNSTVSSPISTEDLVSYAASIVNECQVGDLTSSLNITGSCETVILPSSDPDIGTIVYQPRVPHKLFFERKVKPKYEGVVFTTQPKIRAADIMKFLQANSADPDETLHHVASSGSTMFAKAFFLDARHKWDVAIEDLGTAESPWQLSASIRPGTGHPDGILSGTLNISVSNGQFNFTDLAISHTGAGYVLDFKVISPVEAAGFTLASSPFDVAARPLELKVKDQSSGDLVQNSKFFVTLDIRDEITGKVLPDVSWRDHTWDASVTLLGSSEYGDLEGNLTTTFDPVSGEATFMALNMTGYGVYYLKFTATSTPADYSLTVNHKLVVMNHAHVGMVKEETYDIEVKFEVDFNRVLPTVNKQNEFEQQVLNLYAHLWPKVQLTVGEIYEGSIVVSFNVAGSLADVNSTAYSLCESISNKTTYSFNGYDLELSPFMTVNGQSYYGVTCGQIAEEEQSTDMPVWLIAVIVTLSVLIVALIVCLVVWRCHIKPKTKTHENGVAWKSQMTIEDLLFANGKKFDLGHAPEATTLSKGTEEKRAWSPFSVSLSSESGADSGMTPVGQPPVWPSAKRVVGSEVGRTAWPIPRKVASNGERPKWRF